MDGIPKEITMKILFKAGRTSITVLSVVAAIGIGGAIFLSRGAGAQGNGSAITLRTYGPVDMVPRTNEGQPGVQGILIGLLLPAVQRSAAPFRLLFSNGDLNFVLPLSAPETGRASSFFDVFFVRSPNGDGFDLHIKNRAGGDDIVRHTMLHDVAVTLLPAVQHNGRSVMPLGDNAIIRGFGDGSVTPVPFQIALPAVQFSP